MIVTDCITIYGEINYSYMYPPICPNDDFIHMKRMGKKYFFKILKSQKDETLVWPYTDKIYKEYSIKYCQIIF